MHACMTVCTYLAWHQITMVRLLVNMPLFDFAVEPAFLSVEEHQEFAAGTDAVVKCPANFGSSPPAEMRWTRNDESTLNKDRSVTLISDRFVPESGVLRIQNIRVEDSGSYTCLLYRNGIIGRKTIRVEVLPQSEFAPKINDTIRKYEVMYEHPLTLPCKLVKSLENVTYSWTIDTEYEQDILKNTHAELHRDARKFVSGRYTCRAENKYGYDETDFIVRINGK